MILSAASIPVANLLRCEATPTGSLNLNKKTLREESQRDSIRQRTMSMHRETTTNTVAVRYLVDDVEVAIEFYTDQLGFEVQTNSAPGFAVLERGSLRLLLNIPGAGGGGQTTRDGSHPEPGGWNRFQIEITDLTTAVEQLMDRGANFRTEIVVGKGGKQILLEDPAGNVIELFEPSLET